jgi:acetyl-CoA carboxylase carboxyltransferase component
LLRHIFDILFLTETSWEADKANRFITNYNQKKIPLVFLQDVTGFMVGSKSEITRLLRKSLIWV